VVWQKRRSTEAHKQRPIRMSGSAARISKKGKKSQPHILPEFMPDLAEDTSFQPRKEEDVPAETLGGSSKGGSARPKPKKESRVGTSA
jgi:hypothetical protein